MIATLTPIVTLIATVIGAAIGGINLFQAFKGLLPKRESRILGTLAKSATEGEKSGKEKVDKVYLTLEQSSQRVQQILNRLMVQYVVIAAAGLAAAIILMLSRVQPLVLSVDKNLKISGNYLVLAVLLIALYLVVWPGGLYKLSRITSQLGQIRYLLETKGIDDKAGNLVKLSSTFEAGISRLLEKATKPTSFAMTGNIRYFLPMSLSSAEGELLDAHIKLSTLVSTTEAFLLKTALQDAQAEMEDLAYYTIPEILLDAFKRLIRSNVLTHIQGDLPQREEMVGKQRQAIENEMKRLGLDYLSTYFSNDFFTDDYVVSPSDLEEKITVELALVQKRRRLEEKKKGGNAPQ